MLPDKYVIIWNGKPIGIDRDSGGYPYKTDNVNQVNFFESEEEADKYWKSINWNGERTAIIMRVQFVLNHI